MAKHNYVTQDGQPVSIDFQNLQVWRVKYTETDGYGRTTTSQSWTGNYLAKDLQEVHDFIRSRIKRPFRIIEQGVIGKVDFIANTDVGLWYARQLEVIEIDKALKNKELDLHKAMEKSTVKRISDKEVGRSTFVDKYL